MDHREDQSEEDRERIARPEGRAGSVFRAHLYAGRSRLHVRAQTSGRRTIRDSSSTAHVGATSPGQSLRLARSYRALADSAVAKFDRLGGAKGVKRATRRVDEKMTAEITVLNKSAVALAADRECIGFKPNRRFCAISASRHRVREGFTSISGLCPSTGLRILGFQSSANQIAFLLCGSR